jgi:dTDP-4-dehydrorhamnose reductase
MELNKRTKVMITGCGGMLGASVYERFNRECTVFASDIDTNESWLDYLDIRKCDSVMKETLTFKPDLMINLAALTDLEYCEEHQEESWLTNAMGQENICLAAQKINATVVYISTAGIFDGKQDSYNDFDTPNPLSIYAKSKYYGELTTQRMTRQYYVFRAGWMMGGGIHKDKKFISKIFKQIKDGAKELFVVQDKLGTPTYTEDFAGSMFKIMGTDYYGLYNMVCQGGGSRHDVACEFLRCLGLSDKIKINIVDSDYFEKEYFAPRPSSEKLINLKLANRGLLFMRHWQTCLADYSKVFKKELCHN